VLAVVLELLASLLELVELVVLLAVWLVAVLEDVLGVAILAGACDCGVAGVC
jgi:hypothetical protein